MCDEYEVSVWDNEKVLRTAVMDGDPNYDLVSLN